MMSGSKRSAKNGAARAVFIDLEDDAAGAACPAAGSSVALAIDLDDEELTVDAARESKKIKCEPSAPLQPSSGESLRRAVLHEIGMCGAAVAVQALSGAAAYLSTQHWLPNSEAALEVME